MGESNRLVEQCLANIVNRQPEWRHESIDGIARFKRANDRVAGLGCHVGQRVAEQGPVGVINQTRCNAR